MCEWTSVDDSLPKEFAPVFVLVGEVHVPFQAMWDGDTWTYPILDEDEVGGIKNFIRVWHYPDVPLPVTHWMPIVLLVDKEKSNDS